MGQGKYQKGNYEDFLTKWKRKHRHVWNINKANVRGQIYGNRQYMSM